MKEHLYGWSKSCSTLSSVNTIYSYQDLSDLLVKNKKNAKSFVVRGSGCSYGDNSLGPSVLNISNLNSIVAYSPENKSITVQCGVTFNDILLHCVEDGLIPPVMTGTRYVTIGGALSNNIHGKNCYNSGSIGEHTESIKLLVASGEVIEASRDHNSDLFYAAIGGTGLLGVIVEAKLILKSISSLFLMTDSIYFQSFDELISKFQTTKNDYDYAIANLDMLTSQNLGRGTLSLSKFLQDGNYNLTKYNIPKHFLGFIPHTVLASLCRRYFGYASVSLLNDLIDLVSSRNIKTKRVSLAQCHFLMDMVLPLYNESYRNGFYEYQVALPNEKTISGFQQIGKSNNRDGLNSLMTSLKSYRASSEPFNISFSSIDGYSQTYDIPKAYNYKEQIDNLLRRNDDVIELGGRIYLGKSPVVTEEQLFIMYPGFRKVLELKNIYDPGELFKGNMYNRIFTGCGKMKYEV